MNQHKRTVKYKTEAGEETVTEFIFDVEDSRNIELPVAIGDTDKEVTCLIPAASCRGFSIACKKQSGQESDKVAELTIKTNSTATPGDTFVVTPQNGVSWDYGSPSAIPLSADVTKLFVTNSGTAIVDFAVRIGLDATP